MSRLRVVARADPPLPAGHVPRPAAPLQVPSDCSQYAVEAIRRYGVLRGVGLAAWRLLRCNPWSHGGVDFVEDQTLFRPARSLMPTMFIANVLQPLIDACEAILEFWHDLLGDFEAAGACRSSC